MKRLVKEDLIKTIYGLRDLRTFLIGMIIIFIFILGMERGERVRSQDEYNAQIAKLEMELDIAISDRDTYKAALEDFKEENLQLYKDYIKQYQFWHQSSMLNPVDMHLVFLEYGDMCYYDAYHNNALYYMDENGILNPIYNDDGTIRTFNVKEK